MSKPLGQMTHDERKAAIRRAADRFQAELQASAGKISEIMDSVEAGWTPADISEDEDSDWCQVHGHTGLLKGCTICDTLTGTDPAFGFAASNWRPDGTRRPMLCERRPYPGAAFHCLEDEGHAGPHSDLTLLWNEAGEFCNLDGSVY